MISETQSAPDARLIAETFVCPGKRSHSAQLAFFASTTEVFSSQNNHKSGLFASRSSERTSATCVTSYSSLKTLEFLPDVRRPVQITYYHGENKLKSQVSPGKTRKNEESTGETDRGNGQGTHKQAPARRAGGGNAVIGTSCSRHLSLDRDYSGSEVTGVVEQ